MSINKYCSAIFVLAVFLLPDISSAASSGIPGTQEVRTDIGGLALNSVLVEAGSEADLPPVVFIHGASANLYDPMLSFREKLEGRARLLFVDRPGHGRSDTGGRRYILPDDQADAIARLMEARGIGQAVIVGHSFGGAVAAAFGVRHPEKVVGLVFLSPAVYSWSDGIAWYYDAARVPVTGRLFSTFIAPPLGLLALEGATASVFAPNRKPVDYVSRSKAYLALKPNSFRHNALEVGALSSWAKEASRTYKQIKTPTIIITGDADEIVSPEIHARRLARDIQGAQLIVVHNLGHKSDYVANDLAIAAIEKVAGKDRNLKPYIREVERRLVDDGDD